jgi:hypothetical protein
LEVRRRNIHVSKHFVRFISSSLVLIEQQARGRGS